MGGEEEEGWVQCKSSGCNVVNSAAFVAFHPGSVAMTAPGSRASHLEVCVAERRRSLKNGWNLGAGSSQIHHDWHA